MFVLSELQNTKCEKLKCEKLSAVAGHYWPAKLNYR